MNKKKFDIYEHVTGLFIDSLEKGVIPWKRPYSGSASPYNMVSKKEYQGCNSMMLSMMPFTCPAYVTFKQAEKLGGKIKKGSKSAMVLFWKFLEREDSEGNIKQIPMLRYYNVFNLEQTEGIEIPFVDTEEKVIDSIPSAELIIKNSDTPDLQFNGSNPHYKSSDDTIGLPIREAFNSSEELYSTVFHEMIHSTGHASRLNRKGITDLNRFGSAAYSKEELTAEIGASFLNHSCGFGDGTQDNSEAYVKSWIRKLKDKPKMIVEASGKAQKAVNFIKGIK